MKTEIVFEAGATHTGIDSAMDLTLAASLAGADAIKFQMVDPDRLLSDPGQPFKYHVGDTEVIEPIGDILKRRMLTHQELRKIRQECRRLGLLFYCTADFEEDVDFLESIECDSIKISSSDINMEWLIRKAARTGIPIHLDTGHARYSEIQDAVTWVREEVESPDIVLHHCPPGYPTTPDRVNLCELESLKSKFNCAVGFSDHSPGYEMCIAAVARGVDVVEKTITMNNKCIGPEHAFSLMPGEMGEFVDTIRRVEKAIGTAIGTMIFTISDLDAVRKNRRGYYDGEWKRPDNGVRP